ncbi:hypothetical protein DITRI_Ditri09bG0031100 [Diplodiscus trichospermus]
MERVALRSSSTQAKIIGTIASISGASVVVLYKGPKLLYSSHWISSSLLQLQQPLGSPQSNWVTSGILLVVAYIFSPFWYIIQSQIMKIYPEEMVLTLIYNLSLVIISIPICLLAESNIRSWRLRLGIVVTAVLYSGIFGFSFSSVVHIWSVRLKGPVYVATFRPLSIVITAVMSFIFLGHELYLGTGLYAVLWGKANEEEEEERTNDDDSHLSSSGLLSNSKVPLL